MLVDQGFEHGELIHWLQHNQWSYPIRAKTDLQATLAKGKAKSVEQLIPPFNATVLGNINCSDCRYDARRFATDELFLRIILWSFQV